MTSANSDLLLLFIKLKHHQDLMGPKIKFKIISIGIRSGLDDSADYSWVVFIIYKMQNMN